MALTKRKPHPIFDKHPNYPHGKNPELPKSFSFVSAQTGPNHDDFKHRSLKEDLDQHGYKATPVKGNYGYDEQSYMVEHSGEESDTKTLESLAWKHNQNSVLHSKNNEHKLVFRDNSPSWEGKGHYHSPEIRQYYTDLPSGHRIALDLSPPKASFKKAEDTHDNLLEMNIKRANQKKEPHYYGKVNGVHIFHALHQDHNHLMGQHLTDPSDKDLTTATEAAHSKGDFSVVLHGQPPESLRHKSGGAGHPHSYDWHEGHTDHHDDEDLGKDGKLLKLPQVGNTQAGTVGGKAYKPIAEKYGNVMSGSKTNLLFYPKLHEAEGAVDNLINKHGFQTFMAGGKHGKPNLKERNYNTGHLMIYNPESGSGGDFGNEDYTRTWRKLHELSHALTYPEVNQLYGEGRRLGKLGTRTPNEMKRTVHWEWLAGHKQKELANQIGIKIPKADFHREMNTIMHDAVHRGVT